MNTQKQTTESTPVELSLDQLAEVSGGTPRQGWFTDPDPTGPVADNAVAKTSSAASDA
jgi:hypothetical protein